MLPAIATQPEDSHRDLAGSNQFLKEDSYVTNRKRFEPVLLVNLIRLTVDRESGDAVARGRTFVDSLLGQSSTYSGRELRSRPRFGCCGSRSTSCGELLQRNSPSARSTERYSMVSTGYFPEFAMRWRSLGRTLLSGGIARVLDRIGVGSRVVVVAGLRLVLAAQ